MKKITMKGIIAIVLVIAMSMGMLASADSDAGEINDMYRYFLYGSSNDGSSKVTPKDGTYGFWAYYSRDSKINYNLYFYYEYNGKEIEDKATHFPGSAETSTRFGSSDDSKWFEIYSTDKAKISVDDNEHKEYAYKIARQSLVASNCKVKFRTHSTEINTPDADYLGIFKIKPRVTITGGDGGSSSYKKNCNVKIYLNGSLVDEISNLAFPNDTRAYAEGTGVDVTETDEDRYMYDGYDYSENTYKINFYDFKYTLKYNVNGGSGSVSSQSHGPNSKESYTFTLRKTEPTRSGYKFLGWSDDKNATTAQYSPGGKKKLEGNKNKDGTTGGATATIYAVWQKLKEYTVSYNANGGTGAPASQTKYEEQDITLSSTEPTRDGYKFSGWNTAANGSGTDYAKGATYSTDAALTLYAKWTPITYYVSFDGNGATGGSMTNQTFKYGVSQALSENKFEKKYKVTYDANGGSAAKAEDYAIATFNGWDSQNAVALVGVPFMYSTFAATEGSSPATLAASSASYSDRQVVSNLTTVDGATVPLIANWSPGSVTLPNATKTGYALNGWYSGSTKIGNSNAAYTPTSDVTLTAKWNAIDYTITYNLDGGSVSGNPTSYNIETATFTLNNPTREDYEFAGWTGSNGSTPQTIVTIAKGSTGDKSYTANWKKITFTVLWVNDDGTVLETDTVALGATPTYDGETPEKEKDKQYRYEFAGWTPEVGAVTADITYTATYNAIELPPVADLVIETSGCKETQSFVFTVASTEDADFEPVEVAIVGNGSATIKEIPTGEYTVTEENGWTWRYSEEYEKSATVSAGEENKVTFKDINVPTVKKWLSGLAALFK